MELTGAILAGAGSALGGAIALLFKNLMAAKDAQIGDCREENLRLIKESEYWRDFALSMLDPADKALGLAEHEIRRRPR